MSSRTLIAAVVSSALIVAVVGSCLYVSAGAVLGRNNLPDGALGYGMFYVFFFGWPIALAVTLAAAALGISLSKQRGRRLTLPIVAIPAALLGALVASVAWSLAWNNFDHLGLMGGIGLIAGAAGGVCFWALMRTHA